MENSATLDTATLSLSTQSRSLIVTVNAVSAANIDSRKHRTTKRMSYKPLCLALSKRCDDIQKDNERLVHRIHQVIKQLRRMRVERSFIVARLDKYRDHWKEVESQIDVGTEIPSVELDELLSIEVDDLLSMELYNIKNQEIPETPNQEKNSNMKSTEKKDPILPKRSADPFLGCII